MDKGVLDFVKELEKLAKERGFELSEWERIILNFGPTITDDYQFIFKDKRKKRKE